jgi:peptidoglycan/xylan/chitin deacetylase (PgdA/CDA1 family)
MSLKIALRNGVAWTLSRAGVTAPRRRAGGRLSIVTFHRVLPDADRRAYPYPGLVVTPEELDQLLRYFLTYFDCGTLAAQHARFLRREKTPRPLLAVTLDDGQHDNYRYARVVLARHGVRASFFVPVEAVDKGDLLWHDRLGFGVRTLLKQGRVGEQRLTELLHQFGIAQLIRNVSPDKIAQASKALSPEIRLRFAESVSRAAGTPTPPDFARMMTFGELADLAADGHEIGSHSLSHRMMPECNDQQLHRETAESRRVLEERLQTAIESFCYPNGACDARSAHAVAKAGYRRAVTTAWGSNAPDSDPFQLRRFNMDAAQVCTIHGGLDAALLAFRMSGLYPRPS